LTYTASVGLIDRQLIRDLVSFVAATTRGSIGR